MSQVETVHLDARAALRTKLKALVGLPEVAYEGVVHKLTVGTPYISERCIANGDTPRAIGTEEHLFLYTLACHYPIDKAVGTRAVEGVAGKLFAHFEVGSSVSYGPNDFTIMKRRRSDVQTDAKGHTVVVTVEVLAYTVS